MQEPLHQAEEIAAVACGLVAGAHAVAQEQAGDAFVGEEIAPGVTGNALAFFLALPYADNGAEGGLFAQHHAFPQLVREEGGFGQADRQQRRKPGREALLLFQDAADPWACELDPQAAQAVAEDGDLFGGAEGLRVAPHLLFARGQGDEVLRQPGGHLTEDAGDACVLPGDQRAVFLLALAVFLAFAQGVE